MKLVTLFFTSLLISATAFGQESLSMSLEECIQYALEKNEDIINAKYDNDIAQTQIDETLSQGLPQINGNVGFTNNIEIQNVIVGDSALAFGTNYTGNIGLTASQLIFDGSFFVGLQASKAVKLLSQKEQRQTEVDIVEGVSKAYYLTLIAEENLKFLSRNFQTIDTLLYETTLMYENGFSEKIDVSRIKINHNNVKTDLVNSTKFLITSYNLLKFQMGMPIELGLQLKDDLNTLESDLYSLNVDTTGAIYRRPEYDVLLTNRALVDLNIKNFNYQYIPNLYANFNLGWNGGNSSLGNMISGDWFDYSSIGVNLAIPIFDGLYKSSNIQRNRIQRQQIETSISQLENNIKREVIESVVKHENALRNIDAQKENLELSSEIYQTTRIKYQEGIGSNIEVVQTITDYEEARNNYLSALYDAATSQIELKKALGTLY